MAEGVVLKTDLTGNPPTHPPTASRYGNGLLLNNHLSDLIQILN
jgi:hypothetical protein